MKWVKNELRARWFAQNHDTTFSPNYLIGRHPPTTLSPQAGYIRNLPRGLFGQKKAALFSNFNHRHFVRTEILYNFVGPKQWVGANCIALTDQRRRQEEKG